MTPSIAADTVPEVQHVGSKVRSAIDAGHNDVGSTALKQHLETEFDAIGRSPVDRPRVFGAGHLHFLDNDRLTHGQSMRDCAALTTRRSDAHSSECRQRSSELAKTFRVHSIIVDCEYQHSSSIPF